MVARQRTSARDAVAVAPSTMTAYRFCRTDDMALLAAAAEHCRGPEDEAEPPLDRDAIRSLVRRIDLWCSSSMVALEGREPVAVLLGCKRPDATLVYGLRVHPAHRRRGHGRHLLSSLGQKLAILGPPRLVAEVPDTRPTGRALFAACGWTPEATLVDWERPAEGTRAATAGPRGSALIELGPADLRAELAIVGPRIRCWQRAPSSLTTHPDGLLGCGLATGDRLHAWLLARRHATHLELLALGEPAASEPPGAALGSLAEAIARRDGRLAMRLARVAAEELADATLATAGFLPRARFTVVATLAAAA